MNEALWRVRVFVEVCESNPPLTDPQGRCVIALASRGPDAPFLQTLTLADLRAVVELAGDA